MKQIIVKNYGEVGRDQAIKAARSGRADVVAFWVHSKKPLCICRAQKISGQVTWSEGDFWWSKTMTVSDKMRKEKII